MYLVVHIHKHTYIYNVDIHIQICMYAFKVPLKYVGIRMLQDLGQARREEFGMQVGSMEHRPSTSRDSTKNVSENKTHRPTEDLIAIKMDPLQQLVRTRKECCETYYDRPLCDTDYSGISDDDSLSSSSSFCEYYGRGGGGLVDDEPNGMSFGWFKTRNKKPSSDVYSTVDDCHIMSERCNRESVMFVDQPVLPRTQGSDFSGVAFRRRRRRRRTLATNNISTTREDIEEESPTSLLQKCRSDVNGGDPTLCSTLAPLSTVVHHLTPGQSALLLSQRRFNAQTTSKKLLENTRIDEDVDGVGKGAWKGNVEGTTTAPVAKTESVEENSSDGSTAGSLSMTEESLEEASQQSEASLQILLRHIFSWERDVWCQ